jgi:hypothetical protein
VNGPQGTQFAVLLHCRMAHMRPVDGRVHLLVQVHPLAVAEYAVLQRIDDGSDFNWWVNVVLHRRKHIIALVQKQSARFLKRMQKFGIEVARSIVEVYALNKKNGNTLWADAITKEMKND